MIEYIQNFWSLKLLKFEKIFKYNKKLFIIFFLIYITLLYFYKKKEFFYNIKI